MLLTKETSVYWDTKVKDIVLSYDLKTIVKLSYSANQDLFIYARGCSSKNSDGNDVLNFKINKNEDVYPLFEQFFYSIVESLVYTNNDTPNADKLNSIIKQQRAYHDLVKNGEVHFYSDNTYNEKANLLHITKEDDGINLEFVNNKEDSGSRGFVVRVSNDGSKYAPFNRCFMRLLGNLQTASEDVME